MGRFLADTTARSGFRGQSAGLTRQGHEDVALVCKLWLLYGIFRPCRPPRLRGDCVFGNAAVKVKIIGCVAGAVGP